MTGTMSKSLGNVDAHIASQVARSVTELPQSIGLTSLRSLGWHMADLVASGSRLEALAAAEQLGAEICLAAGDDNPPLREAAEQRGFVHRLVSGWDGPRAVGPRAIRSDKTPGRVCRVGLAPPCSLTWTPSVNGHLDLRVGGQALSWLGEEISGGRTADLPIQAPQSDR